MEGHIVDDCSVTEHKINEECRKIGMLLLITGAYVSQRPFEN